MTAADYQQIRSPENRGGRHYSRFPPSRPCTINHLAGENADGVCRIGEVRLATLALLGVAGGSVAAFQWAEHWLAIDACLDLGGRWDYVKDRCDSLHEDCLNAGGQWDHASRVCSPTTSSSP
jgi:hypothetical protein